MERYNDRKIFLEDLPKDSFGKTDWKNSVGCTVRFKYKGITGKVEITEYIKDKNPKIKIKFNNKEMVYIVGNFMKCRLGRILDRYNGNFKTEIGTNFKDSKRDLVITDKEYRPNKKGKNYKYYKYTCNKCGWTEGWIQESNLIKGTGCLCCTNQVAVLGINTIYDTDPWMMKWISEKDAKTHTYGSNQKITVKCPDCGKEYKKKVNKVYLYKSIGCLCGDGFSYPEKFMNNVLMQLNLDFQTQYSPEYLKRKRSDFYIPSLNLVIETDGGLNHKGGIVHSKSNKTIEEYIEIDKWKDEQHLLYGIETIRINCFESDMEYIKENILNSKLNELFDLSNIDWLKCEEFALKNIVKEVCDYWNNKEDWETVGTILCNNIFGVTDRQTIIDYLKKGTKLGWCEYDPKKEKSKSSSKNCKSFGKPIEAFKDNVSLGVFESASELSRQSKERLGVYISGSSIGNVCHERTSSCKGFVFKYIK